MVGTTSGAGSYHSGAPEFNTGDCLIEVTSLADLTVNNFDISHMIFVLSRLFFLREGNLQYYYCTVEKIEF
jgi:hypothetical protein